MKILSDGLNTSIKRLKRDIENNLKYEKSDVEAVFEKFKIEKKTLVYNLEKEFKLAGLPKLKDFGY